MFQPLILNFIHRSVSFIEKQRPFPGRGKLLVLLRKSIPTPRGIINLRTIDGIKLQIDPLKDKGIERTLYYNGTYEPGTLYIFKQILQQGDVFFDVGSNIGLMALYAARQVGKSGVVHSFEPEPDTFKILSQNVLLNRADNVKLNNIALGSELKEGIIYPNLDINRGASSIVKQDGSAGKKIQISTLDHYLSAFQQLHIKLMKIDVEGYELEMLKGAKKLLRSENAPILCIEYSKDVEHVAAVGDVYDFLININQYRIFRFVAWKEKISQLREVFSKEDMPAHDNVFCFLPSHLQYIDPFIFRDNLKS